MCTDVLRRGLAWTLRMGMPSPTRTPRRARLWLARWVAAEETRDDNTPRVSAEATASVSRILSSLCLRRLEHVPCVQVQLHAEAAAETDAANLPQRGGERRGSGVRGDNETMLSVREARMSRQDRRAPPRHKLAWPGCLARRALSLLCAPLKRGLHDMSTCEVPTEFPWTESEQSARWT